MRALVAVSPVFLCALLTVSGCWPKNDRLERTRQGIERQVRQAHGEAELALANGCKSAFDEFAKNGKAVVHCILAKGKSGWTLNVQWFSTEPVGDSVQLTLDGRPQMSLPFATSEVDANRETAKTYMQYGSQINLPPETGDYLQKSFDSDPASARFSLRLMSGSNLVAEMSGAGLFETGAIEDKRQRSE